MRKLFLILCFLSLPVSAGTWTDWGEVTELKTYASNSFLFKISAPFLGNQNGATDCGGGWYIVSDFTGYKSETISMLLAAFAAGHSVRVNVSGCGGHQDAYTQANYVNVKK